MRAVLALAIKDLRILTRIRSGLVFTILWPLVVAVFFGVIFSGEGGQTSKVPVVIVDQDGTPESAEFVQRLERSGDLAVSRGTLEEAVALVRQGKRTAALVFPPGFGPASRRMFYGEPPKVEVWLDPSRQAEAAMLQGILQKHAAERMQAVISDTSRSRSMVEDALKNLREAPAGAVPRRAETTRYLKELELFLRSARPEEGESSGSGNWHPLAVETREVNLEWQGPRNPFEVTFPQGVLWGIIGTTMAFSISIVSERTQGTFVRLRMAPLTRAQLLAGKAAACFTAIVAVEVLLTLVGAIFFRVRPASPGLFVMAGGSTAVAFVGMMMLAAAAGKTEQAAAGVGWAVMLPLSMLGGGMIPLFLMPSWLVPASKASPVRWAILAIEGAVWRGFSFREMLLPCGILLAIGLACFAAGTRFLRTE